MKYKKETHIGPGGIEFTVTIDPELSKKYQGVVICPEKVAAADEAIAKYGLPEAYYKDQERLAKLKKDNS
jgi:hypothetical protein